MQNIKVTKNPFLLFLPFLIIYTIFIIVFAKNEYYGDEVRYLNFAKNLIHGFYSPPYPYIDLGNGPGYSILISPLVAINAPLIAVKLLNAVSFYFSIVFLFKALQQIVSYKFSLIFSLIWAFYPNVYEQLAHTLPEVLASSLIPILIFALLKGYKTEDIKKARKYIFLAGFTLGFLILTKPIFGYVLIFLTASIIILWVFNIKSLSYKKSLLILLIAFIVNLPYLLYTYNLTGKMFYWSSFGGNNLKNAKY
jgi:4-amino-4-deoxy-L-arabinose transferase-like glycosyltransferase